MVGADHVDRSPADSLFPQGVLVGPVPDRGIHLGSGAKFHVALGRRQSQVVGCGLGGGDVLGGGQQRELVRRRDVEDVDRPAGCPGETQNASGGQEGCSRIPHLRVHLDAGAVAHQRLQLFQAILILRVDGAAAGSRGQDAGKRRIVRHQQGPGRASHEDLDAGAPGQALEFGEVVDIVVARPDEEGVIGPGASPGAAQLVVERLRAGRGRRCVRHFEHRAHAAQHGGPGARFEILLVLVPRFPEMDLAVDHARQHGEAGDVELLPATRFAPDGGDHSVPDGDVGPVQTVPGDDGAADQDRLRRSGHDGLLALGGGGPEKRGDVVGIREELGIP